MLRTLGMAGLLLPAAALAQDASPLAPSAQGDVSVTIYSDGAALIQDVRRLTLPDGVSRQDFPDVATQIRPETVRLSAAGTEIVEQNFDYDLLSPKALIQKAVGQTITLVRTNPATGVETREQAKVLAANGGVVLQIGTRIEVLREDGLPVRVVFSSLPPNLRARPTLSVTLDTAGAGPRPVTLAYLTNGLSWRADYVTLFDEAKSTIDVQGWITLNNQNEVPFTNADTMLVAGNPGSNRGGLAPNTRAGTETAARARLGDFYLYPLAKRTTIAANQQKQVSFLSVGGVPATKAYRFVNGWTGSFDQAQSAATVLQFSSAKTGGIGDALPAGIVRVYIRDAKGQPQFIGESSIGHTPQGSQLALTTGQAFDVKVKPTVVERTRMSSSRWRTSMSYTLTNARPEPVTVNLVQTGIEWGYADTRVIAESLKSERTSASQVEWQVPVPGNGETVVTATFETRY